MDRAKEKGNAMFDEQKRSLFSDPVVLGRSGLGLDLLGLEIIVECGCCSA